MTKKHKKSKAKHSKTGISTSGINLVIGILSIVLIVVVAIGLVKDKQIKEENTKAYDEWKDEAENEKNLSVYEKIKKGKEISLLVIGDGVGLSNGKNNKNGDWIKLLNKWLEDKYNSHANVTNLSYNNGTIYKGFNKIMQNDSKQYDLVISLFGEKNNSNLKVEEFAILYEGIIRQLYKVKNCDIIPVVENSINKDNSYDNIIKKLSKHYNINLANVEEGFFKAQVPYKKLVNESNEPNDKGYEIYFNIISDTINKGIENSRKVSKEEINPLYNNAINLESYNYVTKCSVNHGFVNSKNSMISEKKGSTIEYIVNGNNIGIAYLCSPKGGQVDVFIDDKFIQSINTISKTEDINYTLLSTRGNKESKIKMVQSSDNGKNIDLLGTVGFNS